MSHRKGDTSKSKSKEDHLLREILEELKAHRHLLCRILANTQTRITATITVESQIGEIDMPQTLLSAPPGTDVLTFKVTDINNNDITSRCTFSASSDNPAVVAAGTVSTNTVPTVYGTGTANLTISAVDSGGSPVTTLVLPCVISTVPPPPPPPGPSSISVTAANPTTVIT